MSQFTEGLNLIRGNLGTAEFVSAAIIVLFIFVLVYFLMREKLL